MWSRSETFEAHAAECDRRAKAAKDGQLKTLFADLAVQWRGLAATVRLLEADRRAIDGFFKRRVG